MTERKVPRYVKRLKGYRYFKIRELNEIISHGTCWHKAHFAHLNYTYNDLLNYWIALGYQKKNVKIEPDDIRVPYNHTPGWYKLEELDEST